MTRQRAFARSCRILAAAATAASPRAASAHLDSTGMGPVYDGVLHFLLSPEDLVPAIALALLAGARGTSQGRKALFVLPAAWLAGGVLGMPVAAANGPALVSAAWFLLLGGLLAADVPISDRATALLATVLGVSHGYRNGSGMEAAAVAILGLASAVFAVVALAAGLAASLRATWGRIAIRVAGSWVAAAGLLMVGWAMRDRGR